MGLKKPAESMRQPCTAAELQAKQDIEQSFMSIQAVLRTAPQLVDAWGYYLYCRRNAQELMALCAGSERLRDLKIRPSVLEKGMRLASNAAAIERQYEQEFTVIKPLLEAIDANDRLLGTKSYGPENIRAQGGLLDHKEYTSQSPGRLPGFPDFPD